MRLAWFTPLPPMPSGIADYSSEIVPYLAARSDVDVFCPRPGMFSRARVPRGATLRDPRQYQPLSAAAERERLQADGLLSRRIKDGTKHNEVGARLFCP